MGGFLGGVLTVTVRIGDSGLGEECQNTDSALQYSILSSVCLHVGTDCNAINHGY